jgi:two-component system phosphate regulon response regulator PhoB
MVRTMVALGSDSPKAILIVENEPSASISLRYSLEAAGYGVRLAKTAAEALRLFDESAPDLMLLDLVLPDQSGLDVCRRLRATARGEHTVIIVLSARAEEADRVASFEVGADDFVTKPFSIGELLLRIQARLSNGARALSPAPPVADLSDDGSAPGRLVLGPLRVERASHRVFLDQREITLSAQEMRLLVFLAADPNKMRTRRELLTEVWGYHPEATSRTLDTHIKRLRDKFGAFASMIQTVHGVGYRFALPGQQSDDQAHPPAKRRR